MSRQPDTSGEGEAASAVTTPPWRAGLLLACMAVIGVGLLAAVNEMTQGRIAEQERQQVIRQLSAVLPRERFDNDLLSDVLTISAPAMLGHERPLRVFRARKLGKPVALIMEVLAPNGYNGDITLLLGVNLDGTVSGARVLQHRETPGLGDPIEKRRSDWIDSFQGRALGDPPAARWTVKKDGGDFDQFTGATITPRAVVTAIARALELYEARREWLFAAPADSSAVQPQEEYAHEPG